jgi:hypothetical protein
VRYFIHYQIYFIIIYYKMNHSIDFYGRFLITFGIALQLLHMKFTKSAAVYPMAFYLYGFGCYMVSYNYYMTGSVPAMQSLIKAVNGTMLILIGACASMYHRK